ncbi:transposase [Nocardia cyriacigeorgica]|uniref:transposase n=1 Tax=Nocardia cyriacigeorgica TaxID=135487 RepID=UPI00313C907F
MDRLVQLDEHGQLTSELVGLTAQALGVAERTVWRWLRARRSQAVPVRRERFSIDERLRVRLAYWRGNAAALHRELVEAEKAGGSAAPDLRTVQRAIKRDLTAGELAGLRAGERARRRFDVFLTRPASFRNDAWEADHVEASVQVEVDGRLVKPWVTWFVDAAHDVILGTAVTPQAPSREPILAALRAAVLRSAPYGPAGGLPGAVRIDQGKDFLSRTVCEALGAFAVRVDDLAPYTPFGKGSVEMVNGAVKKMLFAGMPRYTHRQTQVNGVPVDPDQPALTFEAFTAELLGWVEWWNGEHTIRELGDRTPLQSWLDDPTPVHDVDAAKLWMFTLEDDRRQRKITTKGIGFGRGRRYVADWMVGRVGTAVRLRYMPHHTHEVEVFDAKSGVRLGTAVLADQAPPETVAAVRRTRNRKARQLRADLAAAEKARRARYAATTTPQPAKRLDTVTVAEAERELADERDQDLARWSRPDLIPLSPPAPGWVLPVDLDRDNDEGRTRTR